MSSTPDPVAWSSKILAAVQNQRPDHEWMQVLEESDEPALVAAIGLLWSTGIAGEERTARREAVVACLQRKLVSRQVHTMERLERAATKLMWVSIGVAVIGVFVGIVMPLAK